MTLDASTRPAASPIVRVLIVEWWQFRATVGRVAAEEVEVYPPGIPVILEGSACPRTPCGTCARHVTWAARSSHATRRSLRVL